MRPLFLFVVALSSAWVGHAADATSRPAFPTPANSGAAMHLVAPALPPAAAAAAIQLPPGFQASLFAAEPDVQNPIGLAWDARGRLWIAENYTYAERGVKFDLRLRDRIVIFEDRKGDGHFSSRRVFTDDLQRLTSIAPVPGGVWAMCPPQLLFIPDRNDDGIPDGAPEVVLDGFNLPDENYHGLANGLRFGPDGWLYGRCGASAPGELGAPGTPAAARIPMRGTIWRYHPQRKVVEVLGSGTTNPWGHDWDAHGELFFINTVNGHLWHHTTGEHYVRSHTLDPNPYTYRLIDLHADHWHFDTNQNWKKSGDGAANAYGGGHAHVGMMIYLGDNWPAAFRDQLYTLNFHGRRANTEILERQGSGYVARHGPDFFISSDPWFRGQELAYGPDGGVFVLDWSDTGECHNATGVNRLSGRIYKITYGKPPTAPAIDLAQASVAQLVALHTHANEWWVRQARLQLAARAAGSPVAATQLRALFDHDVAVAQPVLRLRALWSLFSIGATDEAFLRSCLRDADEHVRTWAIRLLSDAWPLDTVLSQRPLSANSEPPAPSPAVLAEFHRLAADDPSALVRLALASVLQRLPAPARVPLATALVRHAADADDHNLPLLIWYGLIPVAAPATAAELPGIAAACALPITRQLIARRLSEDLEKNPAPINALLALAAQRPPAFQADILNGLADGLRGWRRAPKPAAWDALASAALPSAAPALAARIRELNVVFGDGRALDEIKRLVLDPKAELDARQAALRTLIENRPPDLRAICEQVLSERFLNTVALRGLTQFDDPALGEKITKSYLTFHHSERAAVIAALVSRPSFASALLAAINAGRIRPADLTPFHARQIRSFKSATLDAALTRAWGELREPAADKRKFITRLETQLTPATLAAADKGRGRAVFNNLCAACHQLYGQGGNLGPDLSGAGRDSLAYQLENIADPSAVVTADYRMNIVKLKDGRTLNGFIAAKTARTLSLRSLTETTTVERTEIASIEESAQSVMPEGLLEALQPTEVANLIAYLMHPTQVPLP